MAQKFIAAPRVTIQAITDSARKAPSIMAPPVAVITAGP